MSLVWVAICALGLGPRVPCCDGRVHRVLPRDKTGVGLLLVIARLELQHARPQPLDSGSSRYWGFSKPCCCCGDVAHGREHEAS